MIEQSNFVVQYTLVMYVSSMPMRNILVVANLAQNVPQLYLNIYPYRFLCFVSKGIEDLAGLCELGESAIFFLAQHEDH